MTDAPWPPWLRQNWWLLPLLIVAVGGTYNAVGHGENRHLAALVAGLAVLPLLLRQRRPEVTAVVNALVVGGYLTAAYDAGPIYLTLLLSVFAITARRAVRAWLPYVVSEVVIVGVGALIGLSRTHDHDWRWGAIAFVWFGLVTAAAAALGTAVRNRTETRAEQGRRAATEERLRMAQDLHDGVGHGLAVIAMQAGVALHVLDKDEPKDPEKVRASLVAIRDVSRESLDALRSELSRLAPVDDQPAPLTPQHTLAELPVLLGRVRSGGLPVELVDESGPVPVEVGAVGYFVVQESLTNVLRHASASRARVELVRTPEGLRVSVSDDGQGGVPQAEGMGISGMRSRVESIGGSLEAGPAADGGFVVRALLPLGSDG